MPALVEDDAVLMSEIIMSAVRKVQTGRQLAELCNFEVAPSQPNMMHLPGCVLMS